MIKIENVDIYGWDAAIRGMRNPMNSWDMSDSEWEFVEDPSIINPNDEVKFVLGVNDLKLARCLSRAGKDHGKFLRYLIVQLDLTAPFYFWKEFKTYRKNRKFMDDGDEILDPEEFEMFIETNSCSTMHKIHAKEFELSDFSWEHLGQSELKVMDAVIDSLNENRQKFIETKDKKYWWNMIQLLPSSYEQKRTVQLNYQVLKSMYFARKNHKLDEWKQFCEWVETLPYFDEICINIH